MAYDDAWAAMHLEMPPRVPRTEYSAEMHWDLMRAVTGIPVSSASTPEVRDEAARAFMRAWDYGTVWSTLIGGGEFGEWRTRMGHAEYMANAEDYDPIVGSPFSSTQEALAFDPIERLPAPDHSALVRRFEKHVATQRRRLPDVVPMTGVYVTCISGLLELFGWELLLDAAAEDLAGFGSLTERYLRWIGSYFAALAEADVPVVMVHDDMVWSSGPIFAPAWYRRFVFPGLKRLIGPLRESGKVVLFTADGNYTEFVDDLARCGVTGFVMEPLTDMALIAERYGKTHCFIGNVDTRALLAGDRSRIRAEVERCMAVGKPCPGFVLAVGNHIPPNTPVESALYYDSVYRELRDR